MSYCIYSNDYLKPIVSRQEIDRLKNVSGHSYSPFLVDYLQPTYIGIVYLEKTPRNGFFLFKILVIEGRNSLAMLLIFFVFVKSQGKYFLIIKNWVSGRTSYRNSSGNVMVQIDFCYQKGLKNTVIHWDLAIFYNYFCWDPPARLPHSTTPVSIRKAINFELALTPISFTVSLVSQKYFKKIKAIAKKYVAVADMTVKKGLSWSHISTFVASTM